MVDMGLTGLQLVFVSQSENHEGRVPLLVCSGQAHVRQQEASCGCPDKDGSRAQQTWVCYGRATWPPQPELSFKY